jgi:Protein of unknown function (DUF2950)
MEAKATTQIQVMEIPTTRRMCTEVTAAISSPVYSAAMLQLTRLGMIAIADGQVMAAKVKNTAATNTASIAAPGALDTVAPEAAQDMMKAAIMPINRRRQEKAMSHSTVGNRKVITGWHHNWVLSVCLLLGLGSAHAALAQQQGQKTFSSAAEAADAFDAAVQNHDEAAMLAILGPSGQDLISSGDPVADKNRQDSFAAQYHASHQFAAAGDGRTFLYLGTENWPTPIPLRQSGSQWYFDTDYGKQEILYRRIGSNEIDAIKVCGAIADAQRDYYSTLHDGSSEHQYAQRFHSTAGTQDGLYWETKAGAQPESPLGPLVAEAAYEGYQHHTSGQPHPFHGYVYRILTSQGANAPGGARGYIVNGKMTGGFALVAYPVSYRASGVMTFIVDQGGQVYQKDLGVNTEQIASTIVSYDPDATWQPAGKATVTAQQ